MEQIILNELSVKWNFKYLWMKYVTWFDLSVHCAKSLIGDYSKKIKNEKIKQSKIVLNESEYKYIYICWVSTPYQYSNNFHLVIVYEKKSNLKIDRNWIYLDIENAKEIQIQKKQNYNIHQKWNIKSYNTCRNWQFWFQETLTKELQYTQNHI